MPGILPMKMIRVGSDNTSRIAQACDRCRSKKIRCDGARPTCSQCTSVGFECKTSDKLSRRAFPRGYTESLEDKVRDLEAEVKELKALLDEKDEKIDMLSRIHNFSRKGSAVPSSGAVSQAAAAAAAAAASSSSLLFEDTLYVETPAPISPSSALLSGPSTTVCLLQSFESKMQKACRPCTLLTPSALLSPPKLECKPSECPSGSGAPPRLMSDQSINLFFQEWQPLLPILHRQSFLKVYEQYLTDPEGQSLNDDKIAVTQLFLIFEIATYSQSACTRPTTSAYETRWRQTLSTVSATHTLGALQCHLLAQLCYLLKTDNARALRHRSHAVNIAQQLGLYKRFNGQATSHIETEMRKKVFWCAYVLDKFTAVTTGMPILLRDTDISSDYPIDVDDENVTNEGILPTLPGELTKMSSAIAFFRLSRVLAKVYEILYPAVPSYSLSISKLHSLSDELDQWHEDLPEHLRLRFLNDKPATHLISDRSPLLSLAYFYTRGLIHRQLLCHGSGSASSAATIVLATAAKHVVQIVDLLDERCMHYTFPVSKQELLVSTAVSILWQCGDLEEDSNLMKDNRKSLSLLLMKMSKENNTAAMELKSICATSIRLDTVPSIPSRTRSISMSPVLLSTSSAAVPKIKTAKKHLQAITSKFTQSSVRPSAEENVPRTIAPQPVIRSLNSQAPSRTNGRMINGSERPAATTSSPLMQNMMTTRPSASTSSLINLDFFPFESDTISPIQPGSKQQICSLPNASRDLLYTDVDTYNETSPTVFRTISSPDSTSADWVYTEEDWRTMVNGANTASLGRVSLSEESLTSGDEFLFSATESYHESISIYDSTELRRGDMYDGIAMPVESVPDDVDLEEGI